MLKKHIIPGFVLLFGILFIHDWLTFRSEDKQIPVDQLASYGDCLLPGIRGGAESAGQEENRFCRMLVLPGGYTTSGQRCFLNTYALSGSPETERYRVGEGLLLDEFQKEEVCLVFLRMSDYFWLAKKMQAKALPEPVSLDNHLGTMRLIAYEKALSFSAAMPNSAAPDDVLSAAYQLEEIARQHISYYERPLSVIHLEVFLSRRNQPGTESFPYKVAFLNDSYNWNYNGLEVLGNRDQKVLGLSPDKRRAIYNDLVILTRAKYRPSRRDHQGKEQFRAIITRPLKGTDEVKFLAAENITSAQLQYIRDEGTVLGWNSEVIDKVFEYQEYSLH